MVAVVEWAEGMVRVTRRRHDVQKKGEAGWGWASTTWVQDEKEGEVGRRGGAGRLLRIRKG